MRAKLGVILGYLGFAHGSSFAQDVVRPSLRNGRAQQQQMAIENELLARAIPMAEYKKLLEDHGLSMPSRDLQEQNNNQQMYSFSGYAIKYATCQPVQYFSEDVIRAGEHSPMLTQDIVVLRLCPSNVCSSNSRYGCHYNFAEYAVTLSDYLEVMLQFRGYQRENVCTWCEQCAADGYNLNKNGNGRRLEDNGVQDNAQENNNADQQQEQANQNNEANQENNNANQENNANAEQGNNANQENNNAEQANNGNQNDNANQDNNENQSGAEGCGKYFDTYCSDYTSECVNNNQDGGNEDSSYVNYNLYLGYLGCTEVAYNGYGYYVRPTCDGKEKSIKMAVYYDPYCSRAAEGVNIKSLGLGFHQNAFQEFYSPDCIDCSESQYPPYFDTGSAFCNNLHSVSAKCTGDLMYDLFDGEADQSSECTFIEGIRFGAYDSSGSLSTSRSGNVWNADASRMQNIMVVISLGMVVFFIIYACYLHHAMTNLLIKSLSHRELLPASRQQRRRQTGDNSVVTGKRRPSEDLDDGLSTGSF